MTPCAMTLFVMTLVDTALFVMIRSVVATLYLFVTMLCFTRLYLPTLFVIWDSGMLQMGI